MENYVACCTLIDFFQTTFSYTKPLTYEEWAKNMGLKIDTVTLVLPQSFLVIWKLNLWKRNLQQ